MTSLISSADHRLKALIIDLVFLHTVNQMYLLQEVGFTAMGLVISNSVSLQGERAQAGTGYEYNVICKTQYPQRLDT